MSLLKFSGVLLGLIAAAALVVGCGETVIDATKTEEQLQGQPLEVAGRKGLLGRLPVRSEG